MTIRSYFYDSMEGDRPYNATDFANAFNVILKNGIIAKNELGQLGFDLGGTGLTTVYAGKAVVNGRFIEVVGVEILNPPAGTYSGQIAIRVDFNDLRKATLEVKTNRTSVQNDSMYELPLYDITVSNGTITGVTADLRVLGGTYSKDYTKTQVDNLLAKKARFYDTTGDGSYLLRLATKDFYGTSTANANVLISITDSEHAHYYLILVAHFQDGSYNNVTKLAGNVLTYQPNTLGSIMISGNVGLPKIRVFDLGSANYV